MIIVKEAPQLTRYLSQMAPQGRLIGFVPTMGALHMGHLNLVEISKKNTDVTVCSIFVNPTQFNNPADYRKYPQTLDKDVYLLEKTGTDILFLPAIDEMYPGSITGLEQYELGYLETVLEGQYRPGHFQGVCQVMSRLLQKVSPHRLYMGQKDYQQCMVVQRLLQILQSHTELVTCPTVREPDGLAMSSRNMRLSAADRQKAPAIYQCLQYMQQHLQPGNLAAVKTEARNRLQQEGFTVDYVEFALAGTLELTNHWNGRDALVGLIAAFLGDVRLIDNMTM